MFNFSRSDPFARSVLVALLVFDLALIGIFIIAQLLEIAGLGNAPQSLVIGDAASLASIALYSKFLMITAIFAVLASKTGNRGYVCMAILFGLLFIDDYFETHERFGRLAAPLLEKRLPAGLPTEEIGEVLFFGVIFIAAVALFTMAWKSMRGADHLLVRQLALLVLALGFCGVGVDVLHSAFEGWTGFAGHVVRGGFGLLEEGGEMMIPSVVLFLALDRMLAMATGLRGIETDGAPMEPFAYEPPYA